MIGDGDVREIAVPEMATPELAVRRATATENELSAGPAELSESDREFEQRAMQREEFLAAGTKDESVLVAVGGEVIPAGPREATRPRSTLRCTARLRGQTSFTWKCSG